MFLARADLGRATPDRITNFTIGDRIDLRGIASEIADPITFIGSGNFAGGGAFPERRYQAISGGIQLQLTLDGESVEWALNLTGATSVTSASFIL